MARRLPEASYPTRLPLRMLRLPIVSGTINHMPVSFVLDTGGTAVSIGRMAAERLDVDQTAFLPPFLEIDLARAEVGLRPID